MASPRIHQLDNHLFRLTIIWFMALCGSSFGQAALPAPQAMPSTEAPQQLNQLLGQYATNRQSRDFVRPFLALAAAHPQDSASLEALSWVLKHFESGTHADRALSLLATDHAKETDLDDIFIYIGNNPSLKVQAFYRQVITENKTDDVLGKTRYRLGVYLVRQMEIAREVTANPEAREKYDLFYGQELTRYLLALDPNRCRAEALKQFAVITEKYPKIKTYHGVLGELATREEYKLVHLSVGGTAAEIKGEDIGGKPLQLSDYRGKVVLLDFWGDWCVACRTLYSFNRSLYEKMENRPFVLIGVNSDSDRNLTNRIVKTQQIKWRSFWDDGSRHGKISTQWEVKSWPVLYVIDGQGVIRLKSVGGHNPKEIYELIDKLTTEIENQ